MARIRNRKRHAPNTVGNGGETHQTAASRSQSLTTNQGTPISDNQNSLRAGGRGPTLLEDFVFREKITHFDHERIPERIVHARGSGAHGYFQPYKSMANIKKSPALSLVMKAPKIGGAAGKGGKRIGADHQLAGGPSIFFDAVVVAASADGAAMLAREAAAIDWIRDAFGHLKVIGVVETAMPLLERAGVGAGEGVVAIGGAKGISAFINAAKNGRVWDREPNLRNPA